jgi:3-methylcrotonyl-CoA carboxylase alpha subunit
VRFDSGVATGSEVTVHYDPLLAKLVTFGQDREEAVERMAEALSRTVVLGVVTNLARLRAIVDHPAFRAGRLHTGFIEEHLHERGPEPCPPAEALAALAAALHLSTTPHSPNRPPTADPWSRLGPWRLGEPG